MHILSILKSNKFNGDRIHLYQAVELRIVSFIYSYTYASMNTHDYLGGILIKNNSAPELFVYSEFVECPLESITTSTLSNFNDNIGSVNNILYTLQVIRPFRPPISSDYLASLSQMDLQFGKRLLSFVEK